MNEPSDSAVAEAREEMQSAERARLLAGEPHSCEEFAKWLIDNDVLPMLLRDVLPQFVIHETPITPIAALRFASIAIALDKRISVYLDEILTEDDARKEAWQRMSKDPDETYDIAGSV